MCQPNALTQCVNVLTQCVLPDPLCQPNALTQCVNVLAQCALPDPMCSPNVVMYIAWPNVLTTCDNVLAQCAFPDAFHFSWQFWPNVFKYLDPMCFDPRCFDTLCEDPMWCPKMLSLQKEISKVYICNLHFLVSAVNCCNSMGLYAVYGGREKSSALFLHIFAHCLYAVFLFIWHV